MRRVMWLTLLCWALWAPAHLQAQPSEYQQALDAALGAHEKGDFASARVSMERAHALSPSARTARGLAIIAHAQGRHAEAVLWCDAALASDVQPLTPALRQSVEELRARSMQALPTPPPSETVEPAPEVALPAAVPEAPPPPAPVEPAAKPLETSKRGWWTRRRRNLSLVLGGVGALGGGALMIVAARRFADVDEACAAQPSGACTRAQAERRLDDDVRLYVRAGAGLLAVGGATLVTALALELWSWRSSERVTVALTPNGALLRGRF